MLNLKRMTNESYFKWLSCEYEFPKKLQFAVDGWMDGFALWFIANTSLSRDSSEATPFHLAFRQRFRRCYSQEIERLTNALVNLMQLFTGSVEILHQNTHWKESGQMQRVQQFLNHIIRHMLNCSPIVERNHTSAQNAKSDPAKLEI